MSNLRFGLVGYGLWGKLHGRMISETEGARLVAVAARSDQTRESAKAACPEAEVHGDYRRLLQRDDVDVVSVVVPNHLHYKVGRAVLEAGKHLLIEKPMTLTAADCDALITLAEKQGKLLAVNHEMRLSALWGRVKELVDEGTIGLPRYALVELSRFPYRHGSEGWRYDIARVGNWILEEPIHFFDLARWYLSACGEPESVYARASSRHPDHPELQDSFSAVVGFPGGAYAVVTQTLAAFEHHVACKLTGTRGAIWASWSAADARSPTPAFSLRYSTSESEDVTDVPYEHVTGEVVELGQQIAAVVAAIRQGTPPPVTGTDGRWAVLLCEAAQRSVETGGVVSLA
jgi:myo-inositol 2-dehydrogenase/D-chiro-inositol 1-dehydrogenase